MTLMSAELKSLFTKLNPVCHKAFEFAADLCVVQGYYSLEIEHLLQKLLDQSDTDMQVILRQYGISIPKLKWELARAAEKCQRGNERTLSLAPTTLSLLREAWLMTSLQFDSHLIRSGAILLAIFEQESLQEEVLKKCPSLLKIPRESLQHEWQNLIKQSAETQLLAQETQNRDDKDEASDSSHKSASPTSAIEDYTLDLTHELRSKSQEPVVGRESEIRQIIDILTRQSQNNIILTGEPGVGKSITLEGVALKMAKGEVPPILQNVSVRVLDRGVISYGIKGSKNIIERISQEFMASIKPMIWFIDDIQSLIGGHTPLTEIIQLLKPALDRRILRVIIVTEPKIRENESDLLRQFQVMKINEPSEQSALTMLRHRVSYLEKHHQVRLTNEAVSEAVHLSHRYLSKQCLPEKAISVLDAACAKVSLAQNGSTPPKLEITLQDIAEKQTEWRILQREQTMGHGHKLRLEQLMAELKQLDSEKSGLEERWQIERDLVSKIILLESSLVSPQKKNKKDNRPLKVEENRLRYDNSALPEDKAPLSEGEKTTPLPQKNVDSKPNEPSKDDKKPSLSLPAEQLLPSKEDKGLFPPAFLRKKKPIPHREQQEFDNRFSLLSFNKQDGSSKVSRQEDEQGSSKKRQNEREQSDKQKILNPDQTRVSAKAEQLAPTVSKTEPSIRHGNKELEAKSSIPTESHPNNMGKDKAEMNDHIFSENGPEEMVDVVYSDNPVSQTEALHPLQTELKALKQQLATIQGNEPLIPAHVDGKTIANVISDWTGLPIDKIRITDELNTLLHLKDKLSERIISQPQAIETLTVTLQTDKAALENPNKPRGIFLLLGPPGVGKTETACALADTLYSGEHQLITINLSDDQITPNFFRLSQETSDDDLDTSLILPQALQPHPDTVILIKNIEKASPRLKALFKQLFDKGRLTDNEGLVIDFKNTLLVFTSHLGCEEITRLSQDSTASVKPETLQNAILPRLLQHFQAEWLRNVVIVPYQPLNESAIREIIELKLSTLQERCRKIHHAQLTYDDSLVNTLLKRCTFVESGAHQIDNLLKDTLLPALSREILERIAKHQAFSMIHLSCDDEGHLVYQFDYQEKEEKEENEEHEEHEEENDFPYEEENIIHETRIEPEEGERLRQDFLKKEANEMLPDTLNQYDCRQFMGDLENVLQELKEAKA